MTEQEQLSTPSLLRRFAAIFYDAWLIFALLLACVGIMILLRIGIEGEAALIKNQPAITGYWRIPTFLLMLFTLCHFYVYFWIKNGQTLGMQTWRIRLDNEQHEKISIKQAYIRLTVALFSLICFGLGFIWMYFNQDRLTWHDKVSKTQLVLLPKTKK